MEEKFAECESRLGARGMSFIARHFATGGVGEDGVELVIRRTCSAVNK